MLLTKVASALEGLTGLKIGICTTVFVPLYDGFLHMMDDVLGPSPMHIKYSSYVYDGFCI